MKNPHLISVDELRAAGALYVPPSWRKSLGKAEPEPDLFSNLVDEEDEPSEAQAPESGDPDGDATDDGSTKGQDQ